MKRVLKILLLLSLLVFLFSSCNYSTNELKNRLIIQAVGIDESTGGKVKVTLQTLNTEMAGNPNSGANLGDAINSITIEGSSIADAISNAAKQVGKKPLLSQNRLIVFGRQTAEKGLNAYLDYFVRNAEDRATVLVAVSDTTAEELVSAKMGESVLTSDSIEDILLAMQFNTNIMNQKLYMLINKLESDTAAAYLPVMKAEAGEDGESTVKLQSVAVFQADRLHYELQDEQVMALQLLSDTVTGGSFSVQNAPYNSTTVLNIKKCTVKIRPQVQGNQIVFQVRVKMRADIAENQTDQPFPISQEYIEETTRVAESYINDIIGQNVTHCFVNQNSDPFCFGMRFKRMESQYYKANIMDWEAVLPMVNVQTETDIKIEHAGNGVENL